MNRTSLCIVMLLAAAFAGCSRSPAPITGKVTYQNQPLNYGRIYFNVNDGKSVGSSEISPEGTFVIEQLSPGKASIAVVVPPAPKNDSKDPTVPKVPELPFTPLKIPEKFARVETSGVSLTVEAGQRNYDVKLE